LIWDATCGAKCAAQVGDEVARVIPLIGTESNYAVAREMRVDHRQCSSALPDAVEIEVGCGE
jgi:hypothetical protein